MTTLMAARLKQAQLPRGTANAFPLETDMIASVCLLSVDTIAKIIHGFGRLC